MTLFFETFRTEVPYRSKLDANLVCFIIKDSAVADAQCVIQSSQLSGLQSDVQHCVRFDPVHACRTITLPDRIARSNRSSRTANSALE
jgi:hypothetical protein